MSSISYAASRSRLRPQSSPDQGGLNFFDSLGEDGWPVIRYFNGNTGVDGEAYIPRTYDMKLCDELGTKKFYLMDFVATVSGATLCSVMDHRYCDFQSLRFLHTLEVDGKDDIESLQMTIDYLATLGTTDPWVWRRMDMVKQLLVLKQEEFTEEL